jgi:hypothetical protein
VGAVAAESAEVNNLQRQQIFLKEAALSYAAMGWPVLPGPLNNGLPAWSTEAAKRHESLESFASLKNASTDKDLISDWWSRHAHAILAPSGFAFDVVRAPLWLATIATTMMRQNICPTAISPAGVLFFVSPGAEVSRPGRIRGVDVLPPGSLISMPPGTTSLGLTVWWSKPNASHKQLPDAHSIHVFLAQASGLR